MSRTAPVLAVVVLVTAGCPTPVEPPPPPPQAQECALDLNFDTTGAQSVTPGTPVTGVLCPAFDRDLFAFDVAEPGTIVKLTLSMDTALTRVNPAYGILKDNGTPDGEPTPFSGEDPQKSQGEPTNFTAAHRLEEPGRYFVVVSDARFVDDAFDITNEYTLNIELVADPDSNEPNNDEGTATVLSPGTVSGQIATSGDQDWYAVDVPAGAQILDVTVDADERSGVEHFVAVLAADGLTEILGAELAPPEPATGRVVTRLRTRVEGGARSYIVVKDVLGENSQLDAALGAYSLTVAVVQNPDDNETATGNDDAATATVVTSGAERTASLASTADQDFYAIGAAGASRTNPSVLIVEVDWEGTIDETFQPQITVFGVDPEAGNQNCAAGCSFCHQNKCKDVRLQRFIDGPGFRTAFPLRDANQALVVINEVGDDAFQEGVGYTIRFEVIDDPDPGEQGDDFLIPNLEFAGFANEEDLVAQFNASKERARVLIAGFGANLPQAPVPEPIDGIADFARDAVDCSAPGAEDQVVTATGRLTYEGDRDYFRIDGIPADGYFALTFEYSATGAGDTPVELALFVYNGESAQPIANTLEAEQTAGSCESTAGIDGVQGTGDRDCPVGSLCVDASCWADGPSNPTFSGHVFPDEPSECAFISPFDSPPYFLEITDNGINDFDPDVTYTFTVTIQCGCPVECNVGGGLTTRCQGVADPT